MATENNMKPISGDQVREMMRDLGEWSAFIRGSLEFREVIKSRACAQPSKPPPNLIFEALRLTQCPRVVIVGQDPYPDGADGLAFSSANIKPSLANIFKCLIKCGLMTSTPPSGSLHKWAREGILLLNDKLTLSPDSSAWIPFTDALIKHIVMKFPASVFILLGNNAIAKSKIIPRNRVFTWSHPSPINTINANLANPRAFINCDCFTRAQMVHPVDWNIPYISASDDLIAAAGDGEQQQNIVVARTQPLKDNPKLAGLTRYAIISREEIYTTPDIAAPDARTWLFTDGGATKNGRRHCSATWAFLVVRSAAENAAFTGNVDIKPTNNRAELLAMLAGLLYLEPHKGDIVIVSDSEYSIGCTGWFNKWINTSKLAGKLNIDIILPLCEVLERIRETREVLFMHVNSHIPKPDGAIPGFIWEGNNYVDSLCCYE